jgi:CubicO group peptidase (beta-lactamase class C family)
MRRASTFLLLLLFTLSTGAQSEGVARRWVDAFNSGSAAAMEQFAQANYAAGLLGRFPADERRSMYEMIWKQHGKLVVERIAMRGDNVILGVKPQRGEPLRLTFGVDPAGKITQLGVDAGGEGEREGPQLPPFKPGADFNASLDEYLKKLDFSGSVLIAKNDQVQFEKAYGLASRRFNIPNKITTRFDIGSITKDFTKAAIGQLAQAGKLRISDTIATHLPDYPNKDVANRITIEQLLKHTSGLGDVFTPEYFNTSRLRFRTLRDYLPVYADDKLLFEPGTSRRYSNYGFIVLGLIIEAVSGESYYDYVKRNIFEPAGMSASGFFESDRIVADVAVGHTRMKPGTGERGDEWSENTLRLPVRGASDGGSHSTARDLFNFDRAIRSHKLLKPAWTKWYFGGPVPTANDAGSDTAINRTGGAFAGGAPGVNAVVSSDGTWTVVVLANIDPPMAEALGERVIRPALK